MNLLELKRYAIDRRVEIRFSDRGADRECLINNKGLVKIPGEDKDFHIEDALETAQQFVIVGNGTTQHLTRDEIAGIITEAFQKKGSHTSADEED